MAEIKYTIRERLRWRRVFQSAFEEIRVAGLLVLPRFLWLSGVKRRIARQVYSCAESEVFLYKSGRAALRGLMEGIRRSSPERRTAYVPDYVCNVVGAACRAAGFEVVEYATDEKCMPDWNGLREQMRRDPAPVLVLCSLFGSVPACEVQAVALEQAIPGIFLVADECQNLVPDSPVVPRKNCAVIFSFNDKACPGLMGGGVACPERTGVLPVYERSALTRRMFCSLALLYRWGSGMLRNVCRVIRLALGHDRSYGIPGHLEYSTCLRPQYDLIAEPIYRLSAARALVSLWSLDEYRRIRMENAKTFRSMMTEEPEADRFAPPFMPVSPKMGFSGNQFPAPVKAAYGRTAFQVAAPNHGLALKINVPFVRYGISRSVVVQLTSRHAITDNRILHCMARTADEYGCCSMILGPAKAEEEGAFGAVQLKACPVLKEGPRPPHICLLAHVFSGAMQSGIRVFQIHDPDLLPVGLLLKLFGRRVIYDVHDDYEASFEDRFGNRKWLGGWFPRLWWGFEKSAARMFDGIITADRHLAGKFKACNPVILGNYPRLDFTPPADAENEETFNLIYVGGVSRERGVGMALAALWLLPQPEVRLHVIGVCRDEGLRKELEEEPRVVLHGRVPWIELHRFYVRAHVGLALYQPRAGFVTVDHSVKILEYMAAGLPVLCADFPGLKALVEDADCGFAVPSTDPQLIASQIRRLKEDRDLRLRLGANGRRLFEAEYHWEKLAPRLAGLYERVVGA